MDVSSESISKESFLMHEKQKVSLTPIAIVMCTLGAIFYCYEYYLRVAPSVMIEELKGTFLLSGAAVGHLTAFYYYAYTPMQIPVGIMTDRFGPRRVLTFACFLCAFGTYLFAATTHISVAQIGRFLVGFGSAFAYVGVLKISNVWLPRKYFAFMAGLCSALGMLGAISGSVTMSHLVELVGWRSTLHYAVRIGFILTLILWLVLRDGDKPGAIEVSHSHQSIEGEVQLQFVRLKEMVKSSQMWIIGIIGCLTFLPISGFAEVWAIQFLETTGMSKVEASWGSSMMFLGFAVGGPIWGIISDVIKSRRLPLIMGSFVSAGLMAIFIFCPSASHFQMYFLLFSSAFFASAEILVFAVSNDLSRPSMSATAVAFTNMFTMVGGATPPLIGKLLDNSLQLIDGVPVLTIQSYSSALAVIPAALFVAGILSYMLKETYRRHS
jgi:MFS family permease